MPAKPVTTGADIESILKEKRVFKPPRKFSEIARLGSMEQYERMYRASVRDPEKFWAKVADELVWFKKWKRVLRWKLPHAEWFVGGQTNLAYNCLDRHVGTARRNKAALIWEGEPGQVRTLTYLQLQFEVA